MSRCDCTNSAVEQLRKYSKCRQGYTHSSKAVGFLFTILRFEPFVRGAVSAAAADLSRALPACFLRGLVSGVLIVYSWDPFLTPSRMLAGRRVSKPVLGRLNAQRAHAGAAAAVRALRHRYAACLSFPCRGACASGSGVWSASVHEFADSAVPACCTHRADLPSMLYSRANTGCPRLPAGELRNLQPPLSVVRVACKFPGKVRVFRLIHIHAAVVCGLFRAAWLRILRSCAACRCRFAVCERTPAWHFVLCVPSAH